MNQPIPAHITRCVTSHHKTMVLSTQFFASHPGVWSWSVLLNLERSMMAHKGPGSRDRNQIFLQKWIIPRLNKSLYCLLNFEDEHLMSCVFVTCLYAVKVKTYARNYIYWSSLPNYLVASHLVSFPHLVSFSFIGWTLDSYCAIVPAPI
jgi:hypothetical protein